MAREADPGATLPESGRTVAEAAATVREAAAPRGAPAPLFSEFRNYRVEGPQGGAGAEADLYRLERDGRPYFLKLYRAGMGPDAEVLGRVRDLSARFPGEIVRIEEAGFDEGFGRHFEIQEWCAGTLADLPRPASPETAPA